MVVIMKSMTMKRSNWILQGSDYEFDDDNDNDDNDNDDHDLDDDDNDDEKLHLNLTESKIFLLLAIISDVNKLPPDQTSNDYDDDNSAT